MDERTYGEIVAEVQAFRSLTKKDREAAMQDLEKRKRGLGSEVDSSQGQIADAEKRLMETKARVKEIRQEYSEAREKRQNAITLGTDFKDFDISLGRLKDEEILLEDLGIGLERRIENLKCEAVLLENELAECRKSILRIRVIPLVGEYNATAKLLGEIVTQIADLTSDMGEPFGRSPSGARTVSVSNYEGLELIPLLYLAGDSEKAENRFPNGRLKNAFTFRDYSHQRQAEREAKAVEQ
jgi:chromosome segregation ATPase